MADCNVRFMDNRKIESSNYTVTNEDVNYPLSNAISTVRSELFKTSTTSTRITIDLGFPDKITALTLFAPLGQTLGITREATIKLQADNVNVWTSPELSIDLSLTSDDRLVYFLDQTLDLNHRFWSLYIDDPANPDVISFADIYMGDYTTTLVRNVAPKITWTQNDKTSVSKSLDGTPYFSEKPKYDSFGGFSYVLVDETDRIILQDLFNRKGVSNWMPICIDPGSYITSSYEELTRLARFDKPFSTKHEVKSRFTVKLSLEEVV